MLDREGIDKHRRRVMLPNAKGGSRPTDVPHSAWEKVACPPETFTRKFH